MYTKHFTVAFYIILERNNAYVLSPPSFSSTLAEPFVNLGEPKRVEDREGISPHHSFTVKRTLIVGAQIGFLSR